MMDWSQLICGTCPDLLSRKHFRRQIRIEELRSAERGAPFCVIEIELLEAGILGKQRRTLIRFLLEHLRVTDYKASLDRNHFGILLSDTTDAGGERVVERIEDFAQIRGIKIDIELQTHTVERRRREECEFLPEVPREVVPFEPRRRAR